MYFERLTFQRRQLNCFGEEEPLSVNPAPAESGTKLLKTYPFMGSVLINDQQFSFVLTM